MEQTITELQTIGDFIRWGASCFNQAHLFFGHGTDNAIDEAVGLVLFALHLPHNTPEILWQTRLTTPEKQTVLTLLQQRIQQRIPAAYLTQTAWFAGLRFYVDSRVLVPRSPIAELIEHQFAPWVEAEKVESILDLCTGSGCIAIASAFALPHAEIDATDISVEALEVAYQNVTDYGLEQRVHCVHSDLFSKLQGKQYDLIVCNPPYVNIQEFEALPTEYHREPSIGLVGGEDGLDFVQQILRSATHHLKPNGVLIVEVGTSQTALQRQYPHVPFTWLEFERGGEGVFLLTAEQVATLT
ncbi:MAG: ribosomal protein L3 N(5)-glutamine methyltransferase [Beggiatoa sp. IS2]|nr:MAG: ribosomal protein L3 N(5)-glutamine methyltransferase [Beggiatoa sp. IS2]